MSDILRPVAMIAAMGDMFCKTLKERNAWKKRFLSKVHGISFPDDFDSLPEKEKARRLDGAIKMGMETK